MDLDKTLATPFRLNIGDREVTCRPITISQIEELRQSAPGLSPVERLELTMRQMLTWVTNSPKASVAVISMSAGESAEIVESWASPLKLGAAAQDIFASSITDQSGKETTAGDPKGSD